LSSLFLLQALAAYEQATKLKAVVQMYDVEDHDSEDH
jgi:hypothetical protein